MTYKIFQEMLKEIDEEMGQCDIRLNDLNQEMYKKKQEIEYKTTQENLLNCNLESYRLHKKNFSSMTKTKATLRTLFCSFGIALIGVPVFLFVIHSLFLSLSVPLLSIVGGISFLAIGTILSKMDAKDTLFFDGLGEYNMKKKIVETYPIDYEDRIKEKIDSIRQEKVPFEKEKAALEQKVKDVTEEKGALVSRREQFVNHYTKGLTSYLSMHDVDIPMDNDKIYIKK